MANKISRAKSIRNATITSNKANDMPGIDSKIEKIKLCQYSIATFGSENNRDIKGIKLDSAKTCLTPIKAKADRIRNTAKSVVKNLRCR